MNVSRDYQLYTLVDQILQLIDENRMDVESDCGPECTSQIETLALQMRYALPADACRPLPQDKHPRPPVFISYKLAALFGVRGTDEMSMKQIEAKLVSYLRDRQLFTDETETTFVLDAPLKSLLLSYYEEEDEEEENEEEEEDDDDAKKKRVCMDDGDATHAPAARYNVPQFVHQLRVSHIHPRVK